MATTRILEMRIHGVSNTPPESMLEAPREEVTRLRGDALGSFWVRRTDATGGALASPVAFSWGAQARTGASGAQAVVRVVLHLAWFLLLPFALVNLAYWARAIPEQQAGADRSWDGGRGAATTRVFGLILTLISVVAFSAVSIDLVARQCFRAEDGAVCAALPAVFDGLLSVPEDTRVALFGIVPILIILALYWIGRRGRVRFDAPFEKVAEGTDDHPAEAGPLLSTRGFWLGARIRSTSEWLHVSAAIFLVVFLLAIDAAFPAATCGPAAGDDVTFACLGAGVPLPAVVTALMLLALGGVAMLVVASTHATLSRPGDDDESVTVRILRQRRLAAAAVIAAAASYLVWIVLTLVLPAADSAADESSGALDRPVGMIATPIVLMMIALFLALSAMNWRQESAATRRTGYVILGVAAVALVAAGIVPRAAAGVVTVASLLALVGFLVFVRVSAARQRERTSGTRIPGAPLSAPRLPALRFQAWDGHGAAVAMMLALFAGMAFSSLLVLGVASWLGIPRPAELEGMWRTPAGPIPVTEWDVPDAYERFAVVLTAVLLLIVFVLIAAAIATRALPLFTLPHLAWRTEDARRRETTAEERGGVEVPDAKLYPTVLTTAGERARMRASRRRISHLAHRGEPLFAWVSAFAITGFVTLSSPVIVDLVTGLLRGANAALPGNVRAICTAVLVAVAVAATGAVVAGAVTSAERPLGVFWDVVAFFPRAGHPFAPPCFAERTVPELAEYSRQFLDSATTPDEDRAMIMTAHSMGSTIAVATILSLGGETVSSGASKGAPLTDRIALLSYGSQLRAYFSRFFPSVFGCQVLGVPGVLGPSLFARDPWEREVRSEWSTEPPSPSAERHTLTGLLGSDGHAVPRWRNLWRRTDYLGFPVFAYRDQLNPVDRGASETAPDYMWRIATHSDYLATEQLDITRGIFMTRLAHGPDDRPAGG